MIHDKSLNERILREERKVAADGMCRWYWIGMQRSGVGNFGEIYCPNSSAVPMLFIMYLQISREETSSSTISMQQEAKLIPQLKNVLSATARRDESCVEILSRVTTTDLNHAVSQKLHCHQQPKISYKYS